MTIRDMIMKYWDLCGHASELYPFLGDNQIETEIDVTAEGTQYFLRLMSEGQIALTNWKKKDFRFLRFKQFYTSKNVQLGVDPDDSFTVSRTAANLFQIDPTQTDFVMDSSTFENSVMVRNSASYKVMNVSVLTPTTWQFSVYPEMAETDEDDDVEDLDDDPTYPQTLTEIQFGINEFDVTLNQGYVDNWRLDLPERVYQILRIDDYETNVEIMRASNKTSLGFKANAQMHGTPAEFQDLGSKLVFDTALLDKRWYRIEMFQQPLDVTTLDEVLTIPLPFHMALVYWGMWQIYLRERSEIHATNYRRLLDTELMSIRDEYDNDFDRSEAYGFKVIRRNKWQSTGQ